MTRKCDIPGCERPAQGGTGTRFRDDLCPQCLTAYDRGYDDAW